MTKPINKNPPTGKSVLGLFGWISIGIQFWWYQRKGKQAAIFYFPVGAQPGVVLMTIYGGTLRFPFSLTPTMARELMTDLGFAAAKAEGVEFEDGAELVSTKLGADETQAGDAVGPRKN